MNNDWQTEFDFKFEKKMVDEWGETSTGEENMIKDLDDIKAFIQSLLDKQADEAAEMQDEAYHKGYGDALKLLDKQREELREWVYTQTIGLDRTEAFNVFLDDLLIKLEKE